MAISVDRWEWVDHAKGIGIMLVVYGHMARGLMRSGLPMNKALFSTIDTVIYSFHMPLFFFLAGLFVFQSLQKRGGMVFLGNKFDTVYYPYILWSLLQGAVELFLSSYTNFHIKWEPLLIFWAPLAQFWFLYFLMGMFTLSAIIYEVSKTEGKFVFVLLSVGTIAWFIPDPASGYELRTANLIYFALGTLAGMDLQWRKSIEHPIWLITASILFLMSECILCSTKELESFWRIPVSFAAACTGIFLGLGIARFTRGGLRNIIVRLGKASLFIYVSHIIIGSGIRIILLKVFKVEDVFLHLCVATFIGLMGPLFLYETCSDRKWFTGLLRMPKILSMERLCR